MAKEKKKRLGFIITLGVVIAVVLLLLGSLIFVEVSIKDLKSSIEENQTKVEKAYEVRSQEIEELIKLLKPKMSLDPKVFTDLEKAEIELKNADGVKALSDANIKVDMAIDKIFDVMKDKYDYLKIAIWDSGIDEDIDTARNRIVMSSTNYNKVAKEYNYAISNFPGDFLSDVFGHETVDSFEIVDYEYLSE